MGNDMDYKQAVSFHEDTKKYGSVLGLDSIRALMHELGDVFLNLKMVHIAGTNGKGSVCCFLASVLKEAGYLTGQFNSPAVFDLREVYQVNGKWIEKEEYAACMEEVAAACGRMTEKGLSHPTVFEVETALAFLWFFRRKCDIVLLEAGMGGETDATNLIPQPLCSVFTSIGMDHMQFLGNSLAEIAQIKAGIIKEGCPVVAGGQQQEVEEILRQRAKERHAAYNTAPEIAESQLKDGRLCFWYPNLGEVKLSMIAGYQIQNAALALKTLLMLEKSGYSMTKKQILKGMEAARWNGRFECLSCSPLFYIDGAHNREGIEKLKESILRYFPKKQRIGIMGVMADKPYQEMAAMIAPVFEEIYTVTPDNPRALPAETLAEEIRRFGGRVFAEKRISDAVSRLYKKAEENSDVMGIAFGSLYYLREVKCALYEITGD